MQPIDGSQRFPAARLATGVSDDAQGSAAGLVGHIADLIATTRRRAGERVVVVGIDGPTASGKSTLAASLSTALTAAGIATSTYQLDWTLRARPEREADVAHLRSVNAEFAYEGELHMRLGLARNTLLEVARFNDEIPRRGATSRTVTLTELYSRTNGGSATGEETLELKPGSVLIVEGHYTLRTELDALIDVNVVLLSDVDELLTRKVERVKQYRNADDATHYFWHTDLPSFTHHLDRFGRNADLVVDNTDFHRPRVVGTEVLGDWITAARQRAVGTPKQLRDLTELSTLVFSDSQLVPAHLPEAVTATVRMVVEWDKLVGHYLRVAIQEVKEDLEANACAAIAALNRTFEASPYRVRLSHTDALYRVYHRKLPLTLGLEIHDADSGKQRVALLAEVESDFLHIGVYWEGGATRLSMTRTLGGIRPSDVSVAQRPPMRGAASSLARVTVFLPTEFTVPSFLHDTDVAPVFIGREQENISAAKILSTLLGSGGVWIHRFSLHREIRFFQYCLAVEGVPSIHIGNYLIAVNTTDAALRQRFRGFCEEWRGAGGSEETARASHDAYDALVQQEQESARRYLCEHARHLMIRDGAVFGNIYSPGAIDEVLSEFARVLTGPHRILRKRAIDFIDQQFPGLALATSELWDDLPAGAVRSITLGELTSLSSSIIAELYLWLALRNDESAVLGANVYDIRRSSLDGRAFLEAASERGCPVVLQCSLNAVGQAEPTDAGMVHGYLQPRQGAGDFTQSVRTAARDLYLLEGKRPPLYGIGLDHINALPGTPPGRAKRFLQDAQQSGGLTHVVLDGSHLFQVTDASRDELQAVFRRMSEWVLDLMDAPGDTFLKDMEICISELNYVGGTEAYVPTTDDIRLFTEVYGQVLTDRGYDAHGARPKLFVANLGTCHHGSDGVTPWVERSREWRDAVKRHGFVSAVLHGTSRSHPETLAAATVGCHKVNVAGDFLDTLINNLPLPLSRTIQESGSAPKTMLAAVRGDMDLLSEGEQATLHDALRDHAARILKTINSPQLSSMDANYFKYNDYQFSPMQVTGILAAVRRELAEVLPAPRVVRRQGAFAASMIEVPDEQFRGPVLNTLWDEGIRHFHIDAGDGTFIPRRFSGIDKVQYLRRNFPGARIHTHLMVVNPHYPKDGEFAEIQQYAEAGTDAIAFHPRACASYQEAISAIKIIRRLGVRPGIVIETSDTVDEHLETLIRDSALDWIIVMGVPIGYGGQVFQYSTLKRISRLQDLASRIGRELLIECDGGLTLQNLELCRDAGGELFSGWSIVKSGDLEELKLKVRAVNGLLATT